MKRSIALSGAVSLFALAAAAQDVPKVEVFTGFTYTRVNSASNVPAFSANGGGGQFVVNAGRHFGFVTDIGAVHNGNIGGYHLDTTLTNFMFGPRFAVHGHRVSPYFQGALRRRLWLDKRARSPCRPAPSYYRLSSRR